MKKKMMLCGLMFQASSSLFAQGDVRNETSIFITASLFIIMAICFVAIVAFFIYRR